MFSTLHSCLMHDVFRYVPKQFMTFWMPEFPWPSIIILVVLELSLLPPVIEYFKWVLPDDEDDIDCWCAIWLWNDRREFTELIDWLWKSDFSGGSVAITFSEPSSSQSSSMSFGGFEFVLNEIFRLERFQFGWFNFKGIHTEFPI